MILLLKLFYLITFWRVSLIKFINLVNRQKSSDQYLTIIYFRLKMQKETQSGQKQSLYQQSMFQAFLEKFVEIVDFKIFEGYRFYRTKWLRGDRILTYKWLSFNKMSDSYIRQIVDFEVSHQIYIKNIENEWLQLLRERKVRGQLQILNLEKMRKLFEHQEEEMGEKCSSDSSFKINQKKKGISKRGHKGQKIKKRKAPKKKKRANKSKIGKQKKVDILQSAEPPQSDEEQILEQTQRQPQTSLMGNYQKKGEGSLSYEEQFKAFHLEDAPQSAQQNMKENAEQFSQSDSILARNVLTDEQLNSNGNSEQYSLESDQVSQVVNQNKVKQFIERRLKQIQLEQKGVRIDYFSPSLAEQDQNLKVEAREKQIKVQAQVQDIQQNQQKDSLFPQKKLQDRPIDCFGILAKELQNKLNILKIKEKWSLPSHFEQYVKQRLITCAEMKQRRLRIINIINIYNVNQFAYFSVNVGSSYFQEQRFMDQSLLKSQYFLTLTKWLTK